ncbi:hypothetical protein DRH13_04380 [Candidatus Woesebacteria bacterium]|nr:MAG: hypothetical protein DRH13_04380 [Candidatus Woesebacteria bacterium]
MNDYVTFTTDEETAKKFKSFESAENKRELQSTALNEYMEKVSDKSKEDFKVNLECLEESAAVYVGLMVQVRQKFEKAKNEQLETSYALWEEWDNERPNVEKKIKAITDSMIPLKNSIDEINKGIDGINLHRLEKILELVDKFNGMSDSSKEVMKFLIENFNQ